MSLWYDVKKKIYASSPNDNWYISYIKKMCDKLSTALSARIASHTAGDAERHTANDIDYSEDRTLKEALDEEISICKDNDASTLKALEESKKEIQNDYASADNILKQELLAEDSSVRSDMENTVADMRQEFNDIISEKSDEVLAAASELQANISALSSDISDLENSKVDKYNNYGLVKFSRKKIFYLPPSMQSAPDPYETEIDVLTLDSGSEITIPALTSDLENDSEYVSLTDAKRLRPDVSDDIPTKFIEITIEDPPIDGVSSSHTEIIEVPDVLSVNTIYSLGVQEDITLILPKAYSGNFIQIDFISRSTPPTLAISANNTALISDFDFTPEPNMIYSLFFDYGILGYDKKYKINEYGWRFSYAEYTYTTDESEG